MRENKLPRECVPFRWSDSTNGELSLECREKKKIYRRGGVLLIIRLLPDQIVIDERARDGTWCALPYPNHKKGCPNIGREGCPPIAPKFEDIADPPYYAVVVPFNLKEHAEKMLKKSEQRRDEYFKKAKAEAKENDTFIDMTKAPKIWTDRQCRNVLYWQGGVRKKLKEQAYKLKEQLEDAFGGNFLVLEIPEANGVNVFTTMFKAGRRMQVNKPDIVHKVMIVVRNKNGY
jgi:hypothetical protein